jgi:hypothetical protein
MLSFNRGAFSFFSVIGDVAKRKQKTKSQEHARRKLPVSAIPHLLWTLEGSDGRKHSRYGIHNRLSDG